MPFELCPPPVELLSDPHLGMTLILPPELCVSPALLQLLPLFFVASSLQHVVYSELSSSVRVLLFTLLFQLYYNLLIPATGDPSSIEDDLKDLLGGISPVPLP